MNARRGSHRCGSDPSAESPEIRVVAVGLGATGRKPCLTFLEKKGVEIVAACDAHPDIAGKDLGEVLGLSNKLDLVVKPSVHELFPGVVADVALYSTVADPEELHAQVLPAMEAGCNVISTSEVLSYPWRKSPVYAEKLDLAA